jgi:transcriptional regulator with XRE-family HTH domain
MLRIKELAEAKDVTISKLQKGTALDMGLVRRYWYNDTKTVRIDALYIIAAYLGVKVGELFTDKAES